MDDDLVLYLDLFSPSSVQGDKLLLRSQAICSVMGGIFEPKQMLVFGKI